MTPKKFVAAFCAYGFSSLVATVFALVFWALVRDWFDGLRPWVTVAGVWLLTVGAPSIGWSVQNLTKTLGIRPQPQLMVNSWRSVPVGGSGVLTDAVKSVLPGGHREPERAIDIPDRLGFRVGGFVFPEEDVKDVLHLAWRRQRSGKSAMARGYWLERAPFYGDRDCYECFCWALEGARLLVNRKPRHSGKLTAPPLTALSELRHSVHRVRM